MAKKKAVSKKAHDFRHVTITFASQEVASAFKEYMRTFDQAVTSNGNTITANVRNIFCNAVIDAANRFGKTSMSIY